MADAEPATSLRGRSLLFLVTEDSYFESHRLPLALHALQQGMRVLLLTRTGERTAHLAGLGIEVHHLPFERAGLNPLRDAALLWQLTSLYRRLQPDVVHHVAIKPVIYGSVAARLSGAPCVVNALAGLGFVFSSSSLTARLLRPLVRALLRRVLSRRVSRVILQNRDDVALLLREQLAPESHIRLVCGVGVDLDLFSPLPEPPGRVRVVLPARMLVDKGVHEFVEAARILRGRGIDAEFVLAGGIDAHNPAAIAPERLLAWEGEGLVRWMGQSDDMPAVLSASHIVCLPSYREGLPKALLEACACGRPIVTTDVPGCREVVRDGQNGLLARARDAGDLADKLGLLIVDVALRARMGATARSIAEREYGIARSVEQTFAIYRELL